ncbi:MAG: acyloxyacyl hydrolase [Verrucomicrobiota bacterium]
MEKMIKTSAAFLAVLLVASGLTRAGEIYVDEKQLEKTCEFKDWSLEIGSGIQFSNIRTDRAYDTTFVPIDLTAELIVDDEATYMQAVEGNNWYDGYTSFLFRGNYSAVTWGVEDYIAGISVGPRYNFTVKDWVDECGYGLIPFVGAEVGFAFADSDPEFPGANNQRGLGQDFNFMFGVEAGFRYDIDDKFFLRLSGLYRHYSNAGLSEPGIKNEAIDSIGPQLSFGVRF